MAGCGDLRLLLLDLGVRRPLVAGSGGLVDVVVTLAARARDRVGTALSMHSDTMGEVLEIFRRNTQITQRALVSLVGRCQTFDCACAATTTSEYYKAA